MKKTVRFIKIGDIRVKISSINRYYPKPKNNFGYPIVIKFSGSKITERFYLNTEDDRDKIIFILDSILLDDAQV